MTASERFGILTRRRMAALGLGGFVASKSAWPQAQIGEIKATERAAMADRALAFMSRYTVPGLSVAIARAGKLVYVGVFGVADATTDEKLTPEHRFRIASISKPITATAILMLMERGLIALDDRVFGRHGVLRNDFGSPPFQNDVDLVTIDHLLTHTAGGWSNEANDPMFGMMALDHRALIDRAIHDQPLDRPPGTGYAYSNFGYCVLGRVIEKVAGQHYDAFVRDAVLRRCGVTGMEIAGNSLSDRKDREVRYTPQGHEDPYEMNVTRMDSHGGWLANPTDLVRYAVHVDGFPNPPDILQSDTIRHMVTPTPLNASYARGWQVNARDNWWHIGSLPGTATVLVRTHSGFCWAACANTRRPDSDMTADLDRLPWAMARLVGNWKA